MSSNSKKSAHVVRSFTDAGTGERFEAGDRASLDAGTFANYEAAGLIRTHSAAEAGSAPARTARRPSSRAKAKSAAPTKPASPPSTGEQTPAA